MPSKLLVIEDNAVIQTLLGKIMSRSFPDAEMVMAADGKEGVEAARELQPDLVLLDWMMPEFDGEYALSEWAGDPELESIPVLVHTVMDPAHIDVIKDKFPFVKGIIRKPIAPTMLVDKLKPFLEGS
jgi:CheY-like chemotaxis protein